MARGALAIEDLIDAVRPTFCGRRYTDRSRCRRGAGRLWCSCFDPGKKGVEFLWAEQIRVIALSLNLNQHALVGIARDDRGAALAALQCFGIGLKRQAA